MSRFRGVCFTYMLMLALWCAAGDSTCTNGTCASSIDDSIAFNQLSLRFHQHRQDSASASHLEFLLARAKQQGEQGEALSAIVAKLAAIPGGLSLLAVTGPKEICDQNAKMASDLKDESTAIEKKQLEEDQIMVDDQLKRLRVLAEGLRIKKQIADDAALPMGKCFGPKLCKNIEFFKLSAVGDSTKCMNDTFEDLKNSSEELCRNASRDAQYHWGLNGSFCQSHECTFETLDQCGGKEAGFCPGLSELRRELESIEKGIGDAFEQYKCSMAKCEAAKDELLKFNQTCEQEWEDAEEHATECIFLAGKFRAAACAYGELLQTYRAERMRFDYILETAKKQEVINVADWHSQMLMVCQLESCNPVSGMIDPTAVPGCMDKVNYAQDIGIFSNRSVEIAALDANWNYESCHLETFAKKEANITMEWCGADERNDADVKYLAFPICREIKPEEVVDSLYGIFNYLCETSLQQCVCSNGEPDSGTHCSATNPEICTSCNSGYHLTSHHTCEESQCTCKNGQPATGAACLGHHEETCSTCNTGYHLIHWHCEPNICKCSHGQPVSGAACVSHASETCSSCNAGYHLVNGRCDPNARCSSFKSNQATKKQICGGDASTIGYMYDPTKDNKLCTKTTCTTADRNTCCKPSKEGKQFHLDFVSVKDSPNKAEIWSKFNHPQGGSSKQLKSGYSCSCPSCSWCKGNPSYGQTTSVVRNWQEFCLSCTNNWGPGKVTIYNTEEDGAKYLVKEWDSWPRFSGNDPYKKFVCKSL
eukprot:TRINITY_DN2606_c0_g2_i3.p1 TRINITY_DN2606_c0_g2~~TRINITY_DN2606_c0_g2_i3.p1  ORF type:complete len:784 (-),score=151.59 TRINITY_DN2606_c0_g2_i3:227-2515(-)